MKIEAAQQQQPPPAKRHDVLVSVFAGALAGVASACVCNPLDTLRVRLAASREATGLEHKSLRAHVRAMMMPTAMISSKGNASAATAGGVVGAVGATGRTSPTLLFLRGMREAFGRGLAVNIIASSPGNAIYLSVYRCLTARLEPFTVMGSSAERAAPRIVASSASPSSTTAVPTASAGINRGTVTLSPHLVPFLAATGAVTATQLCLSPLFVIRTRVQIDPSRTAMAYARLIAAQGGGGARGVVKGFYRGVGTNIMGRAVEEGLFWWVYLRLKERTHGGQLLVTATAPSSVAVADPRLSASSSASSRHHIAREGMARFLAASCAVLGLSGIAKLVATAASYPYNVVMIHQRGADKRSGGTHHAHTRLGPTVAHIYRLDGVKGFYKGLGPHLVRSAVSKSVQIYVFELVMSLYDASSSAL